MDPSQLSTQLWVDKAVNVIHTHAQRTATTSSTQTEGQGAGAQGQEEGEGSTRAPLFLYLAIQNNHSPLVRGRHSHTMRRAGFGIETGRQKPLWPPVVVPCDSCVSLPLRAL